MNGKNVSKAFAFKLITKYFFYGYLCLIGIFVLAAGAYLSCKNLEFPVTLLSVLFLLCAIPLAAQFLKITFSTRYKYRYYKISLYRLKTRGYKDSYFECEMHEPCFRLIISDILKSNGYRSEYYELCKKCHGRNFRVERAKERLLKKVMKEHSENLQAKNLVP